MIDMSTSNITGKRIRRYLEEGKRFDGRNLEDFREVQIEANVIKKSEGSARVKIGNTEVLVGIKMDVGTPYPDSPDEGNMMVTAELLPLSSPRFESGPPRFPAIEVGRIIDRGIRESKFIDTKGLCIKEGEKVWTIFVDIYSINDDGNLLDAAGIGAVVALKTAKIPKYDEEKERVVYGEWTDKKIPLSKDIPLAITVHKVGDKLIVDPTLEEEDISETRVTIGSSNGVISSMQKGSSSPMTVEEFSEAMNLATRTEREIIKKIEKVLK